MADSSTPIGLTATARSDHRVDLTWSWPADPTYPDELDVLRDGVFIGSANPASSTSFEDDDVGPPGSTHSYQLVTVTDGMGSTPTPASVATLRADLPNAPTNIAVTIAPVTNIATVTWTRGALDSDVTYTVTAQQDPGSPIISSTTRFPSVGTDGRLTIDGLASYTSYLFKVSAVEDAGDPPGDPGGTTPGSNDVPARTFDILAPQLNGTLIASRAALGAISATWPAASDSGSGVASYLVCVDTIMCTPVAYQPFLSSQSATPSAPNDGGSHTVTVVAVDGAGNQSSPLTQTVVMPVPGTPLISLQGVQGGDGCHPLVTNVTSADAGTTGLVYHLFVNGVASDSLIGQQITGTPYAQVTLTAQATYGGDSSAVSPPVTPRVYDPDGPATPPHVIGLADSNSNSEALSWDPVTAATGAPVDGYQVTSPTAPGITGAGVFVPQSSAPGIVLKGLAPLDSYFVTVVTVDHCGRPSPPSDVFKFRVSDKVKPTPPVVNPPTADAHNVFLSWAPSSDDVAVGDYTIYRGNTYVGTTPGTTFEDSNLPDSRSFNYYVVSTDTAGNVSDHSNVVTATTKDLTLPTPPGNPRVVTCGGGSASITWSPSSDNVKVAGYRVTRDASTIPSSTSGTTYVDKNVAAGQHTWIVQAVDASGNVSSPRSTTSTICNASPKATAASALRVVKSKGVMAVKVGGKSGQRVVLSFKLTQTFTRAVLHLHVLAGKAKVRVSLPSGSGRTTPGKRLGERVSKKKGILKIPLGTQKSGTLRLVVTAQGGLLTIAGKGGAKAPTIMNAS